MIKDIKNSILADLRDLSVTWQKALSSELESDYFTEMIEVLDTERDNGVVIYPQPNNIFRALRVTNIEDVRVVILGQDPYHGEGQAMGLSFSVPSGIRVPPSLRNIFKEIKNDIGQEPPSSGNLGRWAEQGVFLLNTALTVRANEAGSHSKIGWHRFTVEVIKILNHECSNVVFLLWGNHAIGKEKLIDKSQHLILKAPHPSPLSAHRGFFGCSHFSKTNAYLEETGQLPIAW